MKLYKISESLDVIEYFQSPGSLAGTGCHCVSSGASIEAIATAAHKQHWENLIPSNATSFDYSTVSELFVVCK